MSPTASHYPPSPPQPVHSPPITIIVTVILLFFFLLGFFSIYFCRCFLGAIYNTWHLRRTPSGHLAGLVNNTDVPDLRNGLDPIMVKSYPTFVYSSIKQVCKEKYGLECAICLVEFEDDSLLRLLDDCCHVFHQQCVDLWLESQKTCPVCRRNLEKPHLLHENSLLAVPSNGSNVITNDAVAIDIREENHNTHENLPSLTPASEEIEELLVAAPKRGGLLNGERFPRSNSTGHSIARVTSEDEAGDQDRYRLRLPEHVKMKLLRGHHWTGSCETYAEFQRHWCSSSPYAIGPRFGHVSGSHH